MEIFFNEKLGITQEIGIKAAHRIGSGGNRPLVVKLADINTKQLIFQNTQKLKGTNYFISEQLPEELAEKKKLQQRIKGQNKTLLVSEQLSLNIKRDKIYVNNEQLRPAVVAPSALTWLSKTEDEQKQIKRVALTKGDTDSKTTCTFISYSAEVKSTKDVQMAYEKVFTLEPRATHIVCAYLLPGLNFPTLQGGVDDREFGAARQILKKMQAGGYFNRAVYVARYYGGSNLGSERFRIYKELAQVALDRLPIPMTNRLDLQQLLTGAPAHTPSQPPFVFQPPQMLVRAPQPVSTRFTTPLPTIPPQLPETRSWNQQVEADNLLQSDDSDDDEDKAPNIDTVANPHEIIQEA